MPTNALKTGWFGKPAPAQWALIFLGYISIHLPAFIRSRPVFAVDFYGDLARSFLHGELDLTKTPELVGDVVNFGGHYYLPYPPFPAMILVPFVWLTNHSLNTVFFSVLCGCGVIYMLHRILSALVDNPVTVWWLIAAFMFGSGFAFVVLSSYFVYSFAHVIAVTLCVGMLFEYFGRRRWWMIGVLIACSFLTRQFTLLYIVFFLFAIGREEVAENRPSRFKMAVHLLLPVFGGLLLYGTYNYLRFGDCFETGYRYIVFLGVLKERVTAYGLFSIHYVPVNAYYLLLKGFNITFTGDGLMQVKDVDLWGSSLLASAPYVVCAFKSSLDRSKRRAIWCSILLMLMGLLSYHNNGYEQVNTFRFALDFFPLLFLLVATGAHALPRWLFRFFIIYAISLNAIAFAVHTLAKLL
jgi:hypothetical protein